MTGYDGKRHLLAFGELLLRARRHDRRTERIYVMHVELPGEQLLERGDRRLRRP